MTNPPFPSVNHNGNGKAFARWPAKTLATFGGVKQLNHSGAIASGEFAAKLLLLRLTQ